MDNKKGLPTMLTIGETATELNVAEHFLRRLTINGVIPSVKAGRKYLLCLETVAEFLRTGDVQEVEPQGKIRRIY